MTKKSAKWVVICVAAALGTFLLTEWWPVEVALQLQPYRSWYLIYYLALIYAADLLVRCSLRLQTRRSNGRARTAHRAGPHQNGGIERGYLAVGTESASSFVAIVELLVLSVLLGMLLTSTLHGAAVALMLMLLPLLRQRARNWSRSAHGLAHHRDSAGLPRTASWQRILPTERYSCRSTTPYHPGRILAQEIGD